jgi:hypothetical protein
MLSNHFPPDIRDALVQAASTPVCAEWDTARQRAIDAAVRRARLRYPELFQADPEPMRQVLPIADLFGGASC